MVESQKRIIFICEDGVYIEYEYSPSYQISVTIAKLMENKQSCNTTIPFPSDIFLPALESVVENFISYDVHTEEQYLAIRWFDIYVLCESAVANYEPTVNDMKKRYLWGAIPQMEIDFPAIYKDRMGLCLRMYVEEMKSDATTTWVLDIDHGLVKTELSSNRMLLLNSVSHIIATCKLYEESQYLQKTEKRDINSSYLRWEFGTSIEKYVANNK